MSWHHILNIWPHCLIKLHFAHCVRKSFRALLEQLIVELLSDFHSTDRLTEVVRVCIFFATLLLWPAHLTLVIYQECIDHLLFRLLILLFFFFLTVTFNVFNGFHWYLTLITVTLSFWSSLVPLIRYFFTHLFDFWEFFGLQLIVFVRWIVHLMTPAWCDNNSRRLFDFFTRLLLVVFLLWRMQVFEHF